MAKNFDPLWFVEKFTNKSSNTLLVHCEAKHSYLIHAIKISEYFDTQVDAQLNCSVSCARALP